MRKPGQLYWTDGNLHPGEHNSAGQHSKGQRAVNRHAMERADAPMFTPAPAPTTFN
jgi:hypothetical protein